MTTPVRNHNPIGIRVYIASPYSRGDKEDNVKTSIACADVLMSRGLTPYVPLLSHYQNILLPRAYEDWLAHDLEWILACDVVLRLPGISSGADKEVAYAKSERIRVFYSMHDLLEYINENY